MVFLVTYFFVLGPLVSLEHVGEFSLHFPLKRGGVSECTFPWILSRFTPLEFSPLHSSGSGLCGDHSGSHSGQTWPTQNWLLSHQLGPIYCQLARCTSALYRTSHNGYCLCLSLQRYRNIIISCTFVIVSNPNRSPQFTLFFPSVHPIYVELAPPRQTKMRQVAAISLSLCTSVYLVTATFGYLLFGESTQGDVLANYDTDLGVPGSQVL